MKKIRSDSSNLIPNDIEYLTRIRFSYPPKEKKKTFSPELTNVRSYIEMMVQLALLVHSAYQNRLIVKVKSQISVDQTGKNYVLYASLKKYSPENQNRQSQNQSSQEFQVYGVEGFGSDCIMAMRKYYKWLAEHEIETQFADLLDKWRQSLNLNQQYFLKSETGIQEIYQQIIQVPLVRGLSLRNRLEGKLVYPIWLERMKTVEEQDFLDFKQKPFRKSLAEEEQDEEFNAVQAYLRNFYQKIQLQTCRELQLIEQEDFDTETSHKSKSSNNSEGKGCILYRFLDDSEKDSPWMSLGSQFKQGRSDLIDLEDCDESEETFQAEALRKFVNLFHFEVKMEMKKDAVLVTLKAKFKFCLTRLGFLEFQQIWDELCMDSTLFDLGNEYQLTYDEKEYEAHFLDEIPVSLPYDKSIAETIMRKFDEMLILMTCMDAILLAFAKKGVIFRPQQPLEEAFVSEYEINLVLMRYKHQMEWYSQQVNDLKGKNLGADQKPLT